MAPSADTITAIASPCAKATLRRPALAGPRAKALARGLAPLDASLAMIDPAPMKMSVKVPTTSARSGFHVAFGIRAGFDDPGGFSRNRIEGEVLG